MTQQSFARIVIACSLILTVVLGSSRTAIAAPPKVGIENRIAWSTSRVSGSPEPALPYTTEQVFPKLKFQQCLDITSAPGSDRLFVVEQAGKIFSFPDRADVEAADLVVDLVKEIPGVQQTYSLAFHPDFERNRYCYVCYIKAADLPDGSHIARFRMTDANPPTIDVKSETTILTFLSGGHNGCCLKFGPDGCLYISTGDGGPANPPDILKTGQNLGDLLSSILRIDVDRTDPGLAYHIPADNPFVSLAGARGEVWAYGLRNPWRMSFDRKTGDLWVGDVGWELWELLDRIERGGNYGWAVLEGRQSTNPEWPRGPSPILPPTIEHSHTESSSITDGLTYYGTRLNELTGHHIYSDYDTGKFWSFRFENGQVVDHREIADTKHRVVGFGEDHRGEFYLLDHTAGTIHQLVPNPKQHQPITFPRKLSDSGLFSSLVPLVAAPGVIDYSISAELWSDHAIAERFVALPNDSSIATETGKWVYPKDAVLVKNLSLELRQNDSTSRRRIETQILHWDGSEWLPYTFQWNDDQTDALLVDAAGVDRSFDVLDRLAPGGKRHQTWRYASRAECQRCHNQWSGPPLGFQTPLLHKDHAYRDTVAAQLDTFAHIKLLAPPVKVEGVACLVDPHDSAARLEDRARSYLHVNCAHCHRMHAGGAVLSQMHVDLPLEKTLMIGVRPTQGTFGIHAAKVISPGDPFRSVLYYRINKLGGGRMPYIGSTEIDRLGVGLIHDWIRQLPPETVPEKSAEETAVNLRKHELADLERLRSTADNPDRKTIVDRLLTSTSGTLMLLRAIENAELKTETVSLVIEKGTTHSELSIRDLFERYLPSEQRI